MGGQFNPQVGDRVTAEVLTHNQGTVGVAGMVKQIDNAEVHSHLVKLDEPINNEAAIWFDPLDLSEEYVD